ncbi:undecaprenyl-diphosphate phosphatase [uncultured Paraglaciecola sp.]|uniref:undecaprenyl-diphosphate phosphatase n=1 Tax=uncultured Paraglaciecola sp. TaxID=1765024 RepID=UPI0030DC8D5B|tara:strand:- start:534 stop:1298 length:765 start_codon:yes stop_codon:yes gene_type:complete
MDFLQSIILGIIEGVTEFLPISSTGHLIVASSWLGVEQTEANKAFEVIIQLSAILAVVANYRDKFTLKHRDLWVKVLMAFIPIGCIGLLFHQQIKDFFTVSIVGTMFIVGGIVFLIVESFYKEHSEQTIGIENISYKQAMWIGVAQVFALIPGTSRAGASIVGGLLVGLNRKVSAEFSFLLALPVLAAAAGFDTVKHYNEFSDGNLLILLVGFVTSFIVAYLSINLFMRFLDRFTFVAFGIYRIVFGVILLWLM